MTRSRRLPLRRRAGRLCAWPLALAGATLFAVSPLHAALPRTGPATAAGNAACTAAGATSAAPCDTTAAAGDTTGTAAGDTATTAVGDTLRVSPPYTLGEIVVLASRNEATRSATLHEVGRGRIDELAIRSPRDALEHVPGVYFSSNVRGERGFQLRGLDQRQVSVFLDGVPVSLPFDGLVDVSQFVGTDLDRVRVSHGFSSLLHGANTLGGAVSLFSRPPAATPSLTLRVEGSDHSRLFASAELAGGTVRLRLSGSAAQERARSFRLSDSFAPTANEPGGERANSSYDRRRAGVRAQYLLGESHQLGLHLNVADNSFDVPPNTLSSQPRYWRFPVWRKELIGVNTHHVLAPAVRLRTTWYHDRYHNLLRSFDDDRYTTQDRRYAFDSEYRDHSNGFSLYPSLAVLPFGATDAAISVRRDVHRQRNGTDPFERYATGMLTFALEQDVDLTPELSMMLGANTIRLRPASPAGDTATAALTQLNGQWAARYRHGPTISSRYALARKSRFPTMKELYSSRLGLNLANPELHSESALHGEFGIDVAAADWLGSVSLFHSELQNLITDVVLDGGLRQMQNADRARTQGVELSVERASAAGSVAANYSYLHAANRSADRDSRRLAYRPAHRFNFLAGMQVRERLRLGGDVSHTAGQYHQNLDTAEWERLDDMTWVNLRVQNQLRRDAAWYIRVDNVLDAAYSTQYGVPLPGRELSVGLRIGR